MRGGVEQERLNEGRISDPNFYQKEVEQMNKRRVLITILALALICAGLTTATNAAEKKPIKWKMVSCWTPNYLLIEQDKYWLELVKELVGDQLKIEFYPAGSLMKPFQVFDAVKAGTVQAGGDYPGYWAGRDTAFNLLASYPMGLNIFDLTNWIYMGGGMEEYQRVYGQFGLVYFPHGPITQESGPRSTKPIEGLADYKGLKIRMSGKVQGKVLKDLGASQVKIHSSEVYQAMQKGVLDAAESCTPLFDWNLGYGEITTFSSHPGWHQPGSICGIMINKKAWDALPAHIQSALRIAAQATYVHTLAFSDYTSGEGTRKFESKGVKETHLSEDDLKKLSEMSIKYLYEESAANPSFARVAYSQYKYMYDYLKWRKLSAPLGHGWPDQPLPDLEKLKSYVK